MVKLYFDGACWPHNPNGHMGYGAWVVVDGKDYFLHDGEFAKAGNTNNVAEYLALIKGLQFLIDSGINPSTHVEVLGDSKLVVSQMAGLWKIKDGSYKPYAKKALFLKSHFTNIRFVWIPREKNSCADALSNRFFTESGLRSRSFT